MIPLSISSHPFPENDRSLIAPEYLRTLSANAVLILGAQYKQDRRWNADKPSAALDPYIPIWLTTSPANHRPANFSFFFFYIQRKLGKVVQPQVQLWGIKFKFEVPILWLFQVQIIISIIY